MRLIPAIFLAKAINFFIRVLKIGGGSAAPGLYSLKIEPQLISKLASQIDTNIIITGTNGKTTTARLLSHFARNSNLNVIQNATGSNLARGVASALVSKSGISGKLGNADLGIWELDEAAFNSVVFQVKPQIIVFLNVFRDQLDRYGEVDSVVKKWHSSLDKIDWDPVILVNGGDDNTLGLSDIPGLNFNEFRVKNHQINLEGKKEAVLVKHNDKFLAEILKNRGLSGFKVLIEYPEGKIKVDFNVAGIYHVYDLLAAFSCLYLLNLPFDNINKHLRDFRPAFGRVEKIKLGNKEGYIFLIKNPAGATAVFETISPEIQKNDTLLMVLNDKFADGTDVSWIWDAEFEKLSVVSSQLSVICSGTRAYDLAVRLKYAGVSPKLIKVISDVEAAFSGGLSIDDGRLFILPTYTALLELQQILVKKGIKKHYWKEV